MADAKQVKASLKEGGKKGVDLAGVSDMGGVSFFHVCVESVGDSWELMDKVLEGMNAEVDEAAEERKGGAGGLGKVILSAGDQNLLVLLHLPKALAEANSVDMKEWFDTVTKGFDANVISSEEEVIKAACPLNKDKNLFPLKMRDEAVSMGVVYLRSKGLLPEDDDDDDYIPDPEEIGVEW